MTMTAFKTKHPVPEFHPDSLKDGRLFFQTQAAALGFCPRNKVEMIQSRDSDEFLLRRPVELGEFLNRAIRYSMASKVQAAALLLAARSAMKADDGDQVGQQGFEEERGHLLAAEKAANDIIERCGLNELVRPPVDIDDDTPF